MSFRALPIAVAASVLGLAPLTTPAAASTLGAFAPTTTFVQMGAAADTKTLVVGATWDWSWRYELGRAVVTGYFEASIGRWNADGPANDRSAAWVTQIGITPVVRMNLSRSGRPWFVEAGIGANLLMPIYESGDKRFSTTFNFGDHLGVGRRFGADAQHEVSLRFQHFSNAGIKRPNPGEDFLQLRYSYRV